MRAALVLAVPAMVAGHAAMITPEARNSRDRNLPDFAGGKASLTSCNCADAKKGCDPGVRAPGGGQPCLWFSQGCTIGCETCTGIGSHTDKSLCPNPKAIATLPVHAWTMNRGVKPGSVNDSYRFNPWRAPGSAPVNDACGMAGGTPPVNAGPGDAVFYNSTIARMGELGSRVLKKGPATATYKAGESVEVSWGIRCESARTHALDCPARQLTPRRNG